MNNRLLAAGRFRSVISMVLCLWAAAGVLAAVASTTTNPVGYATVALLANSDAIVSVPFQRAAAFVGTVVSVTGNVVNVEGAPAWAADQFVYRAGSQPNSYYASIRSGAKEGRSFAIMANRAASLTLASGDDAPSGVATGDRLSVIPHWTLGTVFPAASVGVQLAETSASGPEGTRVMVLAIPPTGINPAAAASFVLSGGAWRAVGQLTGASKDDEVVRPDTYLVVRNPGAARTVVTGGTVVMHRATLNLTTVANAPADNPAAPPRPVPVTLNESGLIAGGAFAPSVSAVQRADVLVVFDNATAALKRPAVDFYINTGGAWRKLGAPQTQDFGNDVVFGPGKAAFVRKAAGSAASTAVWINAPSYAP